MHPLYGYVNLIIPYQLVRSKKEAEHKYEEFLGEIMPDHMPNRGRFLPQRSPLMLVGLCLSACIAVADAPTLQEHSPAHSPEMLLRQTEAVLEGVPEGTPAELSDVFTTYFKAITPEKGKPWPNLLHAMALFASKSLMHPSITFFKSHDWAQHFLAGITTHAFGGEALVQHIAQAKEEADSAKSGTGFDYNDLAMTRYGAVVVSTVATLPKEKRLHFQLKFMRERISLTDLILRPQYPHLEPGTRLSEEKHAQIMADIIREENAIRERIKRAAT